MIIMLNTNSVYGSPGTMELEGFPEGRIHEGDHVIINYMDGVSKEFVIVDSPGSSHCGNCPFFTHACSAHVVGRGSLCSCYIQPFKSVAVCVTDVMEEL